MTTLFPQDILDRASRVVALCRQQKLWLTTAESCTGGLIASAITEISGSSEIFGRGFVTYANDAKIEMIGVDQNLIEKNGAVSEPVARAMAEGALTHGSADIAIAVTGIAGPGGGSVDKPVGLIHLACARRGKSTVHKRHVFTGDRTAIRLATVATALDMLLGQN
jgi:nicotinamide-nucleotide amidase